MSDPNIPAPHADATPRLGIPLMHAGQAQKHITHNEALLAVERHLHLSVKRADLGSPPANGVGEGDRFIVAAPANGVWEGHAGDIAERHGGAWSFVSPEPGWMVWSEAEGAHIVFSGAEWNPIAAGESDGAPGSFDTLGIGGASADAGNRLVVRSPATLLTHAESGSHRLVLNRSVESDTASVVFQTGYSGGAELGLVGTGNFEFKVSAEGGDWNTALSVDRSTGHVAFPSGGPRVPETSAVTIHVSPDGDDGADGSSLSQPVATFAQAVRILSRLDLGGQTANIQLAPGTYSDSFKLDRLPAGAGSIVLSGPGTGEGGHGGAGAARIEPPDSSPAVDVTMSGAALTVRDLHAEGFTGLRARYGGVLNVRGTVSLGDCQGGAVVADGGKVDVVGTLELAGGSAALRAVDGGMVRFADSTAKLADGTAWSDAFATAERLGQVAISQMSVEGTATGRRYRVVSNAVLDVDNSTLPGDSSGVRSTGGRYL